MFAVIVDIVEQVKYNNKETAGASAGILLEAKAQEKKVVVEKVAASGAMQKEKEINNIIHNFKREVAILDRIVWLINQIDFSKSGTEKIKHFLRVSTDILVEYRKNMLPRACDCKTGHCVDEI
jgi:hypothetical protein